MQVIKRAALPYFAWTNQECPLEKQRLPEYLHEMKIKNEKKNTNARRSTTSRPISEQQIISDHSGKDEATEAVWWMVMNTQSLSASQGRRGKTRLPAALQLLQPPLALLQQAGKPVRLLPLHLRLQKSLERKARFHLKARCRS